MSLRPGIVECWVFRVHPRTGALEFLLIRRAAHRIFPGLWQCVTGRVEADERVPVAAMREVAEETGFGAAQIEGFYDLDQIVPLYHETADALGMSMIFGARVRYDAVVTISHEHDAARWVGPVEAPILAIWPAYAESVRRIAMLAVDPARARWFALDAEGYRVARQPIA
jgi:8-oxo-dGTP pyrophosphatase MutT (NUDIX family)